MIYSWECQQCQEVTEVQRPVKDIDQGPDNGCNKCLGKDLKRVILPQRMGTKGFILEGQGWHHTEYTATRPIK